MSENDTLIKVLLIALLIAFAASARLMPHPANFAPIAAIAIFGGAFFSFYLAVALPLLAMAITDIVIGFHGLIPFTWGSFIFIALMSNRNMKEIKLTSVVGASMAASVFFFVVTNFGVWLEGRLYPQTFEGLMSSYYNALPFFRNTLLGDLVYTGALFTAYVVVYRYVLHRKGELKVAAVAA